MLLLGVKHAALKPLIGKTIVRYRVADGRDLRAVLRGIDVHTERTLAKGHVHYIDDSSGHIGIGRCCSSETLNDVVTEVRVRAVVVFSLTCLVRRFSRWRNRFASHSRVGEEMSSKT